MTQLQILGMNISSLSEAMKLADFFAKSEIVPKDYQNKPSNIVVAWQKGFELGLSPSQSLESIAVINGRATLWGDTVLAMVRASGLMESCEEQVSDKEAIVTVKRKGEPVPIVRRFGLDDAQRANLIDKAGPWKQYPKRMMQLRARAFALRDGFADVLKGMAIAEEVQDYIEFEKEAISPSPKNFEELLVSLEMAGLSLRYDPRGYAIAEGNVHSSAKLLKGVGFTLQEGKWIHPCHAPLALPSQEAIEPAITAPVPSTLEELKERLLELGLEMEITTNKNQRRFAVISQGDLDGCEESLALLGFTLGKSGKWGAEITHLGLDSSLKEEAESLF